MDEMEAALRAAGPPMTPRRYTGWVGVEAAGEEDAVWLLRAVLVERVLARREGRVLYFPVAAIPRADRAGRVGWVFRRARDLRAASPPRRTVWRRSDYPG